jgi:hypothetical protein
MQIIFQQKNTINFWPPLLVRLPRTPLRLRKSVGPYLSVYDAVLPARKKFVTAHVLDGE